MSDDEEVIYKKPQKTIHYGSLETSEWAKQQQTLEDIHSDEDEYEPETKRQASAFTSQVSAPTLTKSAQISSNAAASDEYYELEREMYEFV